MLETAREQDERGREREREREKEGEREGEREQCDRCILTRRLFPIVFVSLRRVEGRRTRRGLTTILPE